MGKDRACSSTAEGEHCAGGQMRLAQLGHYPWVPSLGLASVLTSALLFLRLFPPPHSPLGPVLGQPNSGVVWRRRPATESPDCDRRRAD